MTFCKGDSNVQKWFGSAGICINEDGHLLMVLQGKPEEKKTWSIPSGRREKDETFEECCIREIEEETGYKGEIVEKIKVKKMTFELLKLSVEVHYFLVRIVDGKRNFQDPDNLIYDIAWKNVEEIKKLELTFAEDRDFLINYITEVIHTKSFFNSHLVEENSKLY
jgi:ADP-ribose pyrophosphatase YjhB (NUDIX family)